MGGRGVAGILAAAVLSAGCATAQSAKTQTLGEYRAAHGQAPSAQAGTGGSGREDVSRRYVDPMLGFEIMRPTGNWQLDANDELSPEGLAIPLVMRQKETGAQVVLQIAPGVASPTQFAEQLTAGLRSHEDFVATDPEPIALAEGAVGFAFRMGDEVTGKVAVLNGKRGEVFMVMATWPAGSPELIPATVDEIIASLRTLPMPAARRDQPASVPTPAPAAQTQQPEPARAPSPQQPMPLGPQYPQSA